MSFSKVVATIPSLEGIHLGLQQEDHQQNCLCQDPSLFSASLQCRLSSLRPRAEFRGEHLFWEGKSSSNLGSWDDRICSVVCFFFLMSSFFRCFAPAVQVDRARWHIELWKVKSCTIGHCRRPIFGNGKEQKNMDKFREITTSQPTYMQTLGCHL